MKISIVIPAYNSGKTIARAIDSVLKQMRPADEIIVIDDGSTDRTAEIVCAYGDKVILIRQQNAGVSVARNTGINAATGDWVAFLDADDEWLPDKLRLQTEHLQRHPELEWTTGNFYRCCCSRGHLRVLDMDSLCVQQCRTSVPWDHEIFENYLAAYRYRATGHTGTMMIRRDLLIKAGLFLPGLKRMNDLDMWYRISYVQPRIGFIFEPLAVYHADVDSSIVKLHTNWQVVDDFLSRHFELAQKAQLSDTFRPCAAILLSYWMRILLTENQGWGVRRLIHRFGSLLVPSFRASCYLGSFCPPLWNWKEKVKMKLRARFRN